MLALPVCVQSDAWRAERARARKFELYIEQIAKEVEAKVGAACVGQVAGVL